MAAAIIETVETSPLRLARCAASGELDGLRTEWDRLAGGVPFRRPQWLETWWRHYRTPNDEIFLLTARDGEGHLVGLAPWYLQRSSTYGRVIRFLGFGKVYSDHLTLLCTPGLEESVAEHIAQWLSDQQSQWDALELARVVDDDPVLQHLVAKLEARDHLVDRRASDSCWRVEFPETWEEYVMRLSKSRRERVRQLIRRQFDTRRAICRQVESAGELDQGFEVLRTLHKRRRESLGQQDCFASPRFAGFLREAAERFLDDGSLRLQWVELEGRPVAVEIDFAGDDTVYYYQSGIEPQVGRERPGWLGTIAALRRAMADGFRYFDFLGGDEAYKSHWRAAEQTVSDLRIVPPRLGARCRHALWKTRESLKQCTKTLLKPNNG